MKNCTRYICYLFCLAALWPSLESLAQPASPNLGAFQKSYGDAASNTPQKIKAFGGYVFVAGQTVAEGQPRGTFSKFSLATGELEWDLMLDRPSQISDFAFDPEQGAFLLVGQALGSRPFIARILDLGDEALLDAAFNRVYELGMPGAFLRILRHPAPADPSYPYYVLGAKTEAPSLHAGRVFLWNFSPEGATKSWADYACHPSGGNELGGALFALQAGRLMFSGKDLSTRHGILVETDGDTGAPIASAAYAASSSPFAGLDIFDGRQLPDGSLAIAGQYLAASQAFIARFQWSAMTAQASVFPAIWQFAELGVNAQGALFAAGEIKSGNPGTTLGRQALHRWALAPDDSLLFLRSWYLEDISNKEDAWQSARLFAEPTHHQIFYADARRPSPLAGFGGFDILAAAFEPGAVFNCGQAFDSSPTAVELRRHEGALNWQAQAPPNASSGLGRAGLNYGLTDFCAQEVPCKAYFEQSPAISADCYAVQFEAQASGTAPFSYCWDFGGSQSGCEDESPAPVHVFPEAGAYQTCLTIVDAAGCADTYCAVAAATDSLPPSIECPPSQSIQVLGCAEGSAAFFDAPAASDNCWSLAFTAAPDWQSGDFFPCGETVLEYTVTNEAGLSASCSFAIVVEGCGDCALILRQEARCGEEEGLYDFEIVIENLTGLPWCSAAAAPGSANISNFEWDCETGTATGRLSVALPLPLSAMVELALEFPCPAGTLQCALPVELELPCCAALEVPALAVCGSLPELEVALGVPASLQDGLVRLDWYVAEDCAGSAAAKYQSTPYWADLSLLPNFFPPDIDSLCLYAVATMARNPCQEAVSNAASLRLCRPPVCSILNGDQNHCYEGQAVAVLPLILPQLDSACSYTVQWYLDGEPIPGATDWMYQPDSLSHIPGSNADCFTAYHYAAEVSNLCGTQICQSAIVISNSAAALGALDMQPLKPQPFCPGEDATLKFTPACATQGFWVWRFSQEGPDAFFQQIQGAGLRNQLFNTNQLFASTWYEIEAANGACLPSRLPLAIEVIPPLRVDFAAAYDHPCQPEAVLLTASFDPAPQPGCTYSISWYKDGWLLHSSSTAAEAAAYVHAASPGSLPGNYYLLVEDGCCGQRLRSDVSTLLPPFEAFILGPCFRCNDEPVVLGAMAINEPPGIPCTFQWYRNGQLLPGATEPELLVMEADATYGLAVDCGGCVRLVEQFLRQCGDPDFEQPSANLPGIAAAAFPNPTAGEMRLTLSRPLHAKASLRLFNAAGAELARYELPPSLAEHEFSIAALPPGVYAAQLTVEGKAVWTGKLVKQ